MRKQPDKTYPCGHCGQLIWRAMALRSGGYCEACEYLTPIQACKEALANWETIRRRSAGKYVHRSDIQVLIQKRLTRYRSVYA